MAGRRIQLPESYASLKLETLRLSHHPESSGAATPVIVLKLYRPKSHNAFTPTMMTELINVFEMFDVDDRVKCIVVTGEGKTFCAGADLSPQYGFKGGQEPVNEHRDGGGRVTLALHHCRKPIIGALQGSAVGVGITMTLPMNIRIALSSAKIGFVFARRGLVMEACSSYFLPRLVGMAKAMHLITTGAVYRADDALLNSLFSETHDTPERVVARALEIAEDVAKNTSSVSTYLMKEMMYRDTGSAEGQHLLDSRVIYELFSSKDNKEGVASFLEKRAPDFKGSMQRDAPISYPWWTPVDIVNRPVAVSGVGKSKL